MKVGKSAAFLSLSLSLIPSESPSKVHRWGKWKLFSEQVSILFPTQTGTIVRCMCCICDNISCCKLAVIMSWCDGVMIPSLSISLRVQKAKKKKKKSAQTHHQSHKVFSQKRKRVCSTRSHPFGGCSYIHLTSGWQLPVEFNYCNQAAVKTTDIIIVWKRQRSTSFPKHAHSERPEEASRPHLFKWRV